jgi:heptosyltransferase-2
MTDQARPLIIRLRNWVGDVVLSTPMLLRLHAQGHSLTLVGKGWAPDLLAGFGWTVLRLAGTQRERVAQLAAWRRDVAGQRWGSPGGINALSLPYSASSALEMRLAGLKAIGYDGEGRALLLHRSWPRPRYGQAGHELEVYWRLGQHLLGTQEPAPPLLQWRISDEHEHRAQAIMRVQGLSPGFVMLCPFAGGTFEGQDKRWPHFEAFVRHAAAQGHRPMLMCPGPGEQEEAQAQYPGAVAVPGVDLGTCAALMRHAALMVSNDTGPGHLAAAVGVPLLSVLGPTEPGHWGAWGPTVHIERHWPRWPTVDEVWHRSVGILGGAW